MPNQVVREVEHLRNYAMAYGEFFIMLNFGLRLSKAIMWNGEKVCINNEMDGSH